MLTWLLLGLLHFTKSRLNVAVRWFLPSSAIFLMLLSIPQASLGGGKKRERERHVVIDVIAANRPDEGWLNKQIP